MADDLGLDRSIRKVEKTALQKFKNQNRVVKKFGKDGLKVYRAIRKTGITLNELVEKTGMDEKALVEILLFLKEKGMAEPVPEGEEGKEEPEMEEEEKPASEEAAPQKKGKPAVLAPEEEVTPPEEITPQAPEEEEEKKPLKKKKEEEEIKPEGEIAPEGEGEIKPEEEEEKKPKESEAIAPSEEIAPEEEEHEEKKEEEEPEKEETEEKGKKEEEEVPLELEEEKEKPEEKEEAPAQEAPPEEEGEIEPEQKGKNHDEEEEEGEDRYLTPGEKKIKGKYGQQGLDVYNLIDGQRTAEEIMNQTGVTENKLIEMLDFMEKEGIIKLEHPGAKKPAPPPLRPAAEAQAEGGFAPMVEEGVGGVAGKTPLVSEGPDFVLDIPSKKAGGIFQDVSIKTKLMIRYKQEGSKAFDLIDGSRDVVEISLKSDFPLYRIYDMFAYLKPDNVIVLKTATRDDIRRKYGEDGYSVYKRYGREGVMLYQLIGKDMDLREMAVKTSKDNKRVVEIFMFIHKLLGIDLPIDEEVLLERLSSPLPPKK